jgi:hypothetical protein
LRVRRLEPTGGPSNEDLMRCAVAFYNEGSRITSRIYDIIINPANSIGPQFPYRSCYDWLSFHRSVLEARGAGESDAELQKRRFENEKACDDDENIWWKILAVGRER